MAIIHRCIWCLEMHPEHSPTCPGEAAERLRRKSEAAAENIDEILWLDTLADIRLELESAAKWPAMNSAHEGYAVILEELDELWEHVKTNQKRRDLVAMRKEALQVAATAIRFVQDVCDDGRGRK